MTRETIAQKILQKDIDGIGKDLYGDASVYSIIRDVNTEVAIKHLLFTANWFEHEHPNKRDLRGEADFASIRLVNALFECYDRLTEEVQKALENFFLHRDYSSIYGSENHALMYRVSRLLAAEFYRDGYFAQYEKSAADVIEEDKTYIKEFLMYRARRAWGEFDSNGYGYEIMLILNTLYRHTAIADLKKMAAMSMDMILLDMAVDSYEGKYGGAHGRIYEHDALYQYSGGMYSLYCFYFGTPEKATEAIPTSAIFALSDYRPAEIVGKVVHNRKFPYENRERKHLHCTDSWYDCIHWDILNRVEGLSIDKYLYMSEDYMLGSVTHQDIYPMSVQSRGYAHHQQHEWELTLPGDAAAKIFSHHPGDPGYHHQHNRWTGDLGCCCGTHFCTKDTAMSLYNIVNENKYPYINADIPLALFDEQKQDGQYLFLRYRHIYIMVWFSNGYHFVTEGETAGFEAVSDGRRHAFLLHVEKVSDYTDAVGVTDFDRFIQTMKAEPIVFRSDVMSLDFMGVHLDYFKNSVDGIINKYPYEYLYDSPYLKSVYGSGILYVTDGTDKVVYDFNTMTTRKE